MSAYRMLHRKQMIELTSVPERAWQATPETVEITVLLTTMKRTRAALKAATELSKNLNAKIQLIAVQAVPYPLSLTSPPVALEFLERQLRALASTLASKIHLGIYLCRDKHKGTLGILKHPSLVILGEGNGWWFAPERRLARLLQEHGHQVITVK